MYKMSLLLPSVSPEKLVNFLTSLGRVTKNPEELEIIIVLDEGKELTFVPEPNMKVVYHPVMDPIYRSKLFETAYRASTAPWIFLVNDDMEILTQDWDTYFDFKDPYRLYYFDDGQFQEKFSCHPLISRKVWEMMDDAGLVFPNFVNMGCDTTIWDVVPYQKKYYIPQIKIRHDRHMDPVKVKEMEKDYEYYNTMASIRFEVTKKIQAECGLKEVKVLIGLSTGEYIRKASFLPFFLALERPAGTLSTTVHGQSPAQARNKIIEQALENNCTHVLFIDDDLEFQTDALLQLLKHDVDGVMGLYLMRTYPHFPVAFDIAFPNGFNKFLYLTPEVNGLIPITNGGLGFVLIKTEVFRKMEKPWVTLGEIEKDGWCDDVSFFNRYRQAGFKLFLDTNVRLGHMTTLSIWPAFETGRWMSNYKHQNGNVLVPQVIPSDEDTAKEIEKNTPLPQAG